MKNTYALYPGKKRNQVTKEITAAINRFFEEYRKIREKHPHYGIGDTQTDEIICSEIYKKIHSLILD